MAARVLSLDSWPFGGIETSEQTGPPGDDDGVTVELESPGGCIVYSASGLHEAQLVLDLLAEAGVDACLCNQHLVGALGELPFAESLPKIWLFDASRYAEARRVVDAYEARRKQTVTGTLRCGACGEESPSNFELCWSCREPLDPESD